MKRKLLSKQQSELVHTVPGTRLQRLQQAEISGLWPTMQETQREQERNQASANVEASFKQFQRREAA